MKEQEIKDLIQRMIDDDNTVNQFALAQTPFHTHNGADSSLLKATNILNKVLFTQVLLITCANIYVISKATTASHYNPF